MAELPKAWPNGKKVAVTVTVMYEAWSEGTAPTYSVQTTTLKSGTVDHAGRAWSSYGGRVGIWRIIRTLDRLGVPATFFPNALCAELYPDSIKQIVRSGHDIAGHAYSQDGLLVYMTLEQQQEVIRQSRDILASVSGKTPTGWITPVLSFTPETHGFLAKEGYKWHGDVTYIDLPHKVQTQHGVMAAIPLSDFTDNRVLRSSPRDLFDVHVGQFNYLRENEPMGLMQLTLHAHFGGRPMIIAVFEQIIKEMQKHNDVWFARHEELAAWTLNNKLDEHTYKDRFFAGAK